MRSMRAVGALTFLAAMVALATGAVAAATAEDLWEAAREGDAETIRSLLEQGVDPNAEVRDGGTALLFAAQRGHAQAVEVLLDHGADPDAKSIVNQTTAVHLAVPHAEILAMLVASGADVNVVDLQTGMSALEWAVLRRCTACIETLLDSPGIAGTTVEQALEVARARGREEQAKLLAGFLDEVGYVPSWPQFRGARASGVALTGDPPVTWNVETSENVLWKTRIPGLSHSSPVVWGDRVFVTTAVSENPNTDLRNATPMDSAEDDSPHEWRVYAVDRRTGEILWHKTLHSGSPRTARSPKNSFASETPATDGRHLVVSFGSHGLYCLDLDGNLLWKRDLGVIDSGFLFDPGYQWGTASSPVLFDDMVIVQADQQEDSFLAAFDLETGEERWRTPRDEAPSWGTPTIYETDGGAQVITNGINAIRGYDARTGEELWRLPTGNSLIAGSTPVIGPDQVVVANGYRPLKPIYALRPAEARGELAVPEGDGGGAAVAWSKKHGGPYYVTPLVYRDQLYILSNGGVLTNYYIATGEEIYRHRVGGGGTAFSASPVAAADRLYMASEDGDVYVYATGLEPKMLAVNPVGELMMATPAIVEEMILLRTRNHLLAVADGAGPASEEQAAAAPEG